ncbi:uncharacterized protein LOC131678139 [Topomyia yanbarensis]|uniref:uncharacterized protein LOC131678139 n=1 Tax=Topomyia yanbarensis TaxID=2498891 RepID=UPI00273BBB41|nr:uncharacterized protein LOC131678139 [Topomyia yanbarensis]
MAAIPAGSVEHVRANGESDYDNLPISANNELNNRTAITARPVLVTARAPKNSSVKNKPKLGTEFVAPDGGWGWMIVLAAGCSNLCTFPVLQQFGMLFRDRMNELSISSSEITTFINTNAALMSIVGLMNGPIFRRFTFRQVAFFGASLVTLGLVLTTISDSFISYMITFSFLYGSGIGITASANSLALNTYFKKKRRYATGFSWTATALGPVVAPHIITYLLPRYGVNGTVLIFAGIAMNAVVCSLLLQPVHWHAKILPPKDVEELKPENTPQCDLCHSAFNMPQKDHSLLSSQYLYNADDANETGYEIIDPGTPMLARANDGWFSLYGSRVTLGPNSRVPSSRPSYINLGSAVESVKREPLQGTTSPARFRRQSNTFNREKEVLKLASRKLEQIVDHETERCTCDQEREAMLNKNNVVKEEMEENPRNLSLLQKIAIFFDLDLLNDSIYVNIMIGITLANFAELNFSVLTPFVLGDFGLTKEQIASAMSLLGAMDICCRFFIPFIAGKIGWENRTFFLFGILNMALGRIVLAHIHTYSVVLVTACWIGFNKGLRTVFMALAIPSHVPLDRLPGATGIQLLFSGVFCLVVGPIVGYVRDQTNYTVTLHCLNIATFATALSWGLEMFVLTPRRTRLQEENMAKLPTVIR